MDQETKLTKRLSIGKASEYLGVSIDTLRRWEKRGKITSLRSPGGHRYFKRQDLENLFGTKYSREKGEAGSGQPLKPHTITSAKENGKLPDEFGDDKNQKELVVPRFVTNRSFLKFEKLLTIPPSNISQQSILSPTQPPSLIGNGAKKTFLNIDFKLFAVIALTIVVLLIALFFLSTLIRGPQILSPVP